jgi:hypothetical protein
MEILDNEIDIYISPEEHEWKVFIGNNAGYYIPIWHKFQKQDTKVHFHLFAMIFNIYWLGFRKMYKYAVAYILLFQVISLFIFFLVGTDDYFQAQLILMIPYPLFGLFSNWIYYNHAQKTIAAIKRTHTKDTSQQKAIQEAGQTNSAFPFILSFLSIFLSIFVPSLLDIFS